MFDRFRQAGRLVDDSADLAMDVRTAVETTRQTMELIQGAALAVVCLVALGVTARIIMDATRATPR